MAVFDAVAATLLGGSSTVGITTDNHGVIGGIWLDAVVSELHTMSNEVTRHTLESGGEVADHVISKPDGLVLECKVTRTPIRVPQSHAGGAKLLDRDIDIPAAESISLGLGIEIDTSISIGFGGLSLPLPGRKAVVQFVDGAAGRITEVYAELQAIMSKKRSVDIITTLRVYEDMQLEEVSVPVASGEGGRVMNFQITAIPIRTAESRIVDAPVPIQSRAVAAIEAGAAAVDELDDSDVGAEKASFFHRSTH